MLVTKLVRAGKTIVRREANTTKIKIYQSLLTI